MKLNIGCGKNKLKGFINLDISPNVAPDIVRDIERGLPFGDNTFDDVVSSHTLEHIADLIFVMNEIWRVCKPGALVRLTVPYYKSPDAYRDPTHVRFFTEDSLQYFCGFVDDFSDYGIRCRFELVEQQILEEHELCAMLRAIKSVADGQTKLFKSVQVAEIAELKRDLEARDGYVRALHASLDEKDAQVQALQAALEEETYTSRALQTSLDERTIEAQALQATLMEKTDQIEAIQDVLSQKNTQSEALHASLDEMDAQVQALQAALEEETSTLRALQTSLDERTIETQALQATLMGKTSEAQALQISLDIKTAQIQALQASLDVKTAQVQALQTTLDERTADVQALQTTLDERTADVQALQTTLDERTADVQALQTTLDERTAEAQALQISLDIKTAQIQALQASLDVKTAQVQALQTTLDERTAEAQALQTTLDERTAEAQALQTTLDGRTAEAQVQQGELASIKQSLIWRATTKFQSLVERFLPLGTRWRGLYELGLAAIRAIVNEGWKSFVRKVRARLSVRRAVAKSNVLFREWQVGFRSRVHRLRDLALTAIDIIIHEGWRSFWRQLKVKARRAGIRRDALLSTRLTHAPAKQPYPEAKHCPTARRYKVLFIVGLLEFESSRYRVYNVIEAAKLVNLQAEAALEIDIDERLGWMMTFDIVVMFRAGWSYRIERLLQACKAANVITIFDIDDYVFEPEIMPFVDGIRKLGTARRKSYEDGVRAYRKTLLECDYATAPTECLASRIEELGKQCFVIRNALSRELIEISKDALSKTDDEKRNTVRIGYFSGTFTHQKDFGVAAPSLTRILREFGNVELVIVGFLDMAEFPELKQFKKRVKQIPFMPWRELPYQAAEVDINITPLEFNNPFCEAKSELKYFESAILKKPTVASSTGTFKSCIENGFNGFLVSHPEEFYEHLKKLITDEGLRQQIGENAYIHTMNTYSPTCLAKAVKDTYTEIVQSYRRQTLHIAAGTLSISFVVPTPFMGSGGHKTIFLLTNCLAEAGHRVKLYFTDDGRFGTQSELHEFVSSNFSEPLFEIILGVDNILCCDALFATHWSTAYVVREYRQNAARCFYFVQDFEPLFHPMGTEYLRAENTYKFGFYCISMGPWLAGIMRERYNCDADFIPFWIEEVYHPKERKEHGKRIAFFFRPQMPRRCFELGLEALQLFHKRNPEVEIILFGSSEIGKLTVPFRHTNLGVLAKDDLAHLYSNIDCGLTFATTNPSFVPYEMMAARCPVIDVAMEPAFDEMRYRASENVALVEPDPESIALKLEEILSDENLRHQLAQNGYKFVSSFPTQREAFLRMDHILRRELGV